MRNGPLRFTGRRVHLEENRTNFKPYTNEIREPPEFDPQDTAKYYETRDDFYGRNS